MMNFFKGLLGGIGNIVPGLSGSAILIILNIYEMCLNAIYELFHFKNIKKNVFLLFPIGLGIAVGTILFGNIIMFFIEKYPLPTTAAFFGLILGTIPLLFGEANKKGFNKKYIIPFLVTFGLGVALIFFSDSNFSQLDNINFFQAVLLGFIVAGSTIVPGISSTVLLSMLGMYNLYLIAVAKIDLVFLFPVGIGLLIGGLFFVILMRYLLENCYGYTFYAILGFVISTIPTVLRGNIAINVVTLISVIISILAFLLTYHLGKLNNTN